MEFPAVFDQQVRYLMWRLYAPAHPFLRGILSLAGVAVYPGRGDYLLGTLAPGRSLVEFVDYLILCGFGNHFMAWRYEGELVGLRLVENFKYQYHLRIFEDGEVRGHYEYTPECYPVKHVRQVDMEHRRDEFLALLDGWVIPRRAASQPTGVRADVAVTR
ncbi:MAG TPA: hypothetical protein VMV50_00795 [Candidatus Paceibacterota bacterium]|nr:hypothetical protein [Candidatus Paceibacterota bacterium]